MTEQTTGFIWYELLTTDVDAARQFYGTVIGWTAEGGPVPDQAYWQWSMNGTLIGGLMALPPGALENGAQPGWLAYLNVADVDARIAAIVQDGGALHMPAWDIPGVGRAALVGDPQGAAFYVMSPTGTGPSLAFSPMKPGHACWNELHASDWKAAFDFYAKHFGWGQSNQLDMGPMGIYCLFNNGSGDAIGGMMTSPAFPKPAWLFYFGVEDIDTAKALVETAGGSVVMGPQEVPGGVWVIQARDPQGAIFALVGARKI